MPISTVNTMLTSFITSQHDHGGYLCMLINNLNVQERVHLPLSSLSLAGQTFAREARNYRDYLPVFLLFLSLPLLLPFIQFTHLQPDGLPTEMKSQSQLSAQQQPPCRVPRLLKRRGVWTPDYVSTNSIRSQVQQGERQCRRAYRRRPTAMETQEKRQRRKHAHHGKQLTRAGFQAANSRQHLDANQSN